MRNALATGQKHLWMNDFDMRIAGLIMTFDISIPRFVIDGEHTTSGNLGALPVSVSQSIKFVLDFSREHSMLLLRVLAELI